uniref:Ig-like domain-containing protein n=1 Tax=Nothobranchius furzeri TaxID=105023 RepID=A0A8C6L7C8_NOTFU
MFCRAQRSSLTFWFLAHLQPPFFLTKLSPADVVKGSSAFLQCQVVGTSPFEVTWLKDGKELKASSKHGFSHTNNALGLEVHRCDSADVGEYQVTVAGRVGSCTCRAALTLKEPPTFTRRLENSVTVLGQTAEFQCAVTGSATLSVQWQKDQNWILEDPKFERTFENNVATLRIPACEVTHGGRYTCQVMNELLRNFLRYLLCFVEPPQIVEKPEEMKVTIGDPVSLDCKVKGSPELKGGGLRLVPQTRLPWRHADRLVTLTGVFVTEQVIAPSFTRPLVDLQEVLGSFVQLCCKISGSLPISVEWQKDGRRISSGVKHKLLQQDNSVSLEMEQLELSDAGSYSCRLTNEAGSCECRGSLRVKGQMTLFCST